LSKSIETQKIIARLKCCLNKFLKEYRDKIWGISKLIENQNKVKILKKKGSKILKNILIRYVKK